jgi:parallel beta-helix repeat protein
MNPNTTPRALAFLGALMLSCAFSSSASASNAVAVSCGETIIADTKLASDLVDCPNNGIVIGADDVTLDLNGHLIDGDGASFAGCPEEELCDGGVVNEGHEGVTVRDGSVRSFGIGVFVGGARDNRVLGISSSRNLFAGIGFGGCSRSVVRNSSGNANVTDDGDGMFLLGSHDVRVVHSVFRGNGELGIHVGDSSSNVIKGNVLAGAPIALLIEGDRNEVSRNSIHDNDGNIIVSPGNRNVIARNHISRGAAGTDSPGIAIENGVGNLIARNTIVHVRGVGIRLGLESPPIGGADNVVRRNVVRRSGDDGLLVDEKDHHSLLVHNLVIAAGDDGIDVNSETTRLKGNEARRSADLGIEAVVGAIDGGGNRAHGSGDPLQCEQVMCG